MTCQSAWPLTVLRPSSPKHRCRLLNRVHPGGSLSSTASWRKAGAAYADRTAPSTGHHRNSRPTSNRYRQLRSTSAASALGCELGYNNPAMIPTLVRPHRVRQPVCSEPVYCVTTPVTTGPIANPSPDKVLTRDAITATSRGRMPGNSNGSTSMVGETIHTTPHAREKAHKQPRGRREHDGDAQHRIAQRWHPRGACAAAPGEPGARRRGHWE